MRNRPINSLALPGTYVPSVDIIVIVSPFTLSVNSNVPMHAKMARVTANVFISNLKVNNKLAFIQLKTILNYQSKRRFRLKLETLIKIRSGMQ